VHPLRQFHAGAARYDTRLHLRRIRLLIPQRSVDQRTGDALLGREDMRWIAFSGQVLQPHDDLPDVRASDRRGAPAGRPDSGPPVGQGDPEWDEGGLDILGRRQGGIRLKVWKMNPTVLARILVRS